MINKDTKLPFVQLTGVGKAVPDQVLTNDHLATLVATSDEWISSRTGIKQRRVLAPEQSLTELAAIAAHNALQQAGRSALDVDLLILATSTPEDLFGGATRVQRELGAARAVAFDLTAACSGFIFALATASQYIQTGKYQTVLVIGADALSRWTDWTDRTTCVLFGDAAGAVVLEAATTPGLIGFELRSDGMGSEDLAIASQTEAIPLTTGIAASRAHFSTLAMNGSQVYRFAVAAVPDLIQKTLLQHDIAPEQVKGYFLHQANQRILDAVAQRLNIPSERVATNVARYGNTSSASIPLVLEEWSNSDACGGLRPRLQPGDLIVLAGFGAGLSWGAMVARWGRF